MCHFDLHIIGRFNFKILYINVKCSEKQNCRDENRVNKLRNNTFRVWETL